MRIEFEIRVKIVDIAGVVEEMQKELFLPRFDITIHTLTNKDKTASIKCHTFNKDYEKRRGYFYEKAINVAKKYGAKKITETISTEFTESVVEETQTL